MPSAPASGDVTTLKPESSCREQAGSGRNGQPGLFEQHNQKKQNASMTGGDFN
jgi:hypothetical protein